MDQQIFNWIVGCFGALGGWILKVIWDAIQDLKSDIKDVDRRIHEDFVRRDDFKDAIREIKDDMRSGFGHVDKTLGLIFKKLENKEDK